MAHARFAPSAIARAHPTANDETDYGAPLIYRLSTMRFAPRLEHGRFMDLLGCPSDGHDPLVVFRNGLGCGHEPTLRYPPLPPSFPRQTSRHCDVASREATRERTVCLHDTSRRLVSNGSLARWSCTNAWTAPPPFGAIEKDRSSAPIGHALLLAFLFKLNHDRRVERWTKRAGLLQPKRLCRGTEDGMARVDHGHKRAAFDAGCIVFVKHE